MRHLLAPLAALLLLLLLPPEPGSTRLRLPEAPTGAEVQNAEYDELFAPYDGSIPLDVLQNIWAQIDALDFPSKRLEEAPWENIGPLYIDESGSTKNYFYGRITEFEIVVPEVNTRIAANTGGLWWQNGAATFPIPLSDNLNTLTFGAFVTHPLDSDVIFAGTGFASGKIAKPAGLGLFRTLDAGANWTHVPMDPLNQFNDPRAFYRLHYDAFDFNRMHAATTSGYWQSADGGATWSKLHDGAISDFAQHPSSPNILYFTQYGSSGGVEGGLYRSETFGLTWSKVTAPGIATVDVGRGALSVVGSSQPRIYVSFANGSSNEMLGVYRSDDDCQSWTDITPDPDPESFVQGWHNNAIAADPLNPDIVLLGWVDLFRSSSGGLGVAPWTKITQSEGPLPGRIHPDILRIRFESGGAWVGMATDGGLYVSHDSGVNWTTEKFWPITQFYHLDVHPTNWTRVAGGAQDNGISMTNDAGVHLGWRLGVLGDGGGIAMQARPFDPIHATNGVNVAGPLAYSNLLTVDDGLSWPTVDDGLFPTSDWTRRVRSPRDNVEPNPVYTTDGPYVYAHENPWAQVNPVAFQTSVGDPVSAGDITIIHDDGMPMWVTTKAKQLGDDRVFYVDAANNWNERSTGLPVGRVLKVAGNRYGGAPSSGYALMMGFGNAIEHARVWYTWDCGVTWTNLTGNLPDVPVTDLIESPIDPNVLFLATAFGAFKTEDKTASPVVWQTWNEGWPRAVDVREFSPYFDFDNEIYWIYAATYGRSAYRRPLTQFIPSGSESLSHGAVIEGAFPNPSSGPTTIHYRGFTNGLSRLTVYDARGRRIRELASGVGHDWRETIWDGRDARGERVAAGVYHVVLESGAQKLRRKLVRLP